LFLRLDLLALFLGLLVDDLLHVLRALLARLSVSNGVAVSATAGLAWGSGGLLEQAPMARTQSRIGSSFMAVLARG
jgi:hypothetical protein